MSSGEGFFVDWNGEARDVRDPGAGYSCEVDAPARYVAIFNGGALVHEATLYKTVADLEKAGIKAKLVPGSTPWGRPQDGF